MISARLSKMCTEGVQQRNNRALVIGLLFTVISLLATAHCNFLDFPFHLTFFFLRLKINIDLIHNVITTSQNDQDIENDAKKCVHD